MSKHRVGIEHRKRLLEAAYEKDERELRRVYRTLQSEQDKENCERLIKFFIVKRHEIKYGL